MVVKYDKESDVIYIQLSENKVFESEEDKPGIILDYGENGEIVGVEILNASEKTSQPNGIVYEVA
jgi:uncharacterized protein YuzE